MLKWHEKYYKTFKVLGVSHFDEVFLMFKFSSLNDLAVKTEEDALVSQKLVSMWTNFAKTGKPTEGDADH